MTQNDPKIIVLEENFAIPHHFAPTAARSVLLKAGFGWWLGGGCVRDGENTRTPDGEEGVTTVDRVSSSHRLENPDEHS